MRGRAGDGGEGREVGGTGERWGKKIQAIIGWTAQGGDGSQRSEEGAARQSEIGNGTGEGGEGRHTRRLEAGWHR
ncbi:MAG: hypothetical protein EAZ36_06485 [Verrucomicrobia bacterium]|nr:MAG: hypothetical protein EAZ36_06485 [Verrucomicrobiota bacterium]